MSVEQRLRRQYADLQQQWEKLNDQIALLQQGKIRETRIEEEIRLQGIIDSKTADLNKIAQSLSALETRLKSIQTDTKHSAAKLQRLPQLTTTGCLSFQSGGTVRHTRLFAKKLLTLGRPKMAESDLWLTLLPTNKPEHHQMMNAMSRQHAYIDWDHHPLIKDGGSRNFTFINGEVLNTDWCILRDGDEIAFQRQRVLVLRARCEAGQWLRLDRVNNGADEENYLLLNGHATIGGQSPAIPAGNDVLAELSHIQGGFVLSTWSEAVTVNGDTIDNVASIGLHDSDRMVIGDLSFDFYVTAYPV